MIELFGFRLGRTPQAAEKTAERIPSFVLPYNEDGAVEVAPGGSYGMAVDFEGIAKTESDLITKYRDLILQPEVENAVDDIINEAIVITKKVKSVEIILGEVALTEEIKEKIRQEFSTILDLLNFQNLAFDIFRRWYVDGRLYYHIMVDEELPREGIKELRYIDPRRMRKVREAVTKTLGLRGSSADMKVPAVQDYYIYKSEPQYPQITALSTQQDVRVAPDSICYVHSGLFDQRNQMVLSYLHKAIKPMNQLRMLEDATVIYRLARAPERRIFYIDVGTLPKVKAEQYLRDMMVKHKNRLVYDGATGEIRDDRKFMTLLEDFWLPRREGSKGTEITTLAGGQNLGQMEDVEYFRKRLYKALNVPTSRLEADGAFNLGRPSEITRDELKFAKFITRLRARFTHLFDNLLEIQLSLKGIMTREEWEQIKNSVSYDFLEDNYFTEAKHSEILTARLTLLQTIESQIGKYYSKQWVQKNILRLTEKELVEIQVQIDQESSTAKNNGEDGAVPNGEETQPDEQKNEDVEERNKEEKDNGEGGGSGGSEYAESEKKIAKRIVEAELLAANIREGNKAFASLIEELGGIPVQESQTNAINSGTHTEERSYA